MTNFDQLIQAYVNHLSDVSDEVTITTRSKCGAYYSIESADGEKFEFNDLDLMGFIFSLTKND